MLLGRFTELGYQLREPSGSRSTAAPHYRYLRRHAEGTQKIDVMVAGHVAPFVPARFREPHALGRRAWDR